MTDTSHLGLPYIEAGQAQKHVTHNEALRILDAVIQVAVQDASRTAPPGSPADGQRHLVAASPTGAWAGRAKAIATWQDGAWAFLTAKADWCVWSLADSVLLVFDGSVWRDMRGLFLDNAARLGINTTADATNRLSVKSNAVLFGHDDVTPGTGDLRATFNKSAASKDAALIFQDAFSTRALIGLLGDDNFTVKVSADGATYRTALAIDKSTGQASLEASPKFLAYQNFDKYCAASTFTKVQFNATRHNDQSAFDATNNQFVAPAAGYYAFGFRVMFKANATAPTVLTATMYKNGAELLDDTRVQTTGTLVSNRTWIGSNSVLKLAAGDTIAVWVSMTANDGYVSAAQNSFYGHRIA